MTILVTGANGQLGNELRILAESCTEDKFIFTDINSPQGVETTILDITDAESVLRCVKENKADVIINCAAFTNVDAAESNPELAEKLNAGAPSILARAAKEEGALLVHISTDYVFGKEPYNTPCTEDRQGTPTGVYGLTKLNGEQAVTASSCRYVIIRTAWLYSEFGKNFCKTMMSLSSSKPELKVVFDQCGTPTYAGDLAEAILTIIKRPVEGIYNYSNEGVCSWFDFARTVAEYAGNSSCNIQPCHSNEFPSPVTRPSYSVLDKTKIKETYGISIPYWTESLRKCIAKLV